nr:restriction endonuclease subunit S [Rhodovulum sulfidophilum]
MITEMGLSERRACRIVGLARSVQQYRPVPKDDAAVVERMKALASENRRYGYLRLDAMLRREGLVVKGRSVTSLATPHPYIRVTDMRMGKVDLSNIHYVPEDVAPTISRYTIDAGDLYISCAGSLGIVGQVPDILHGANLTENANRISAIRINPTYLLHVLMSEMIQGHIQNIQTVGAQPKLALGRIRSFEIPCPNDPKEQKAIAEALSDADALIEGLERLIAKKRLIKQGAMQDLLTAKRRLPGFSGEWVKTNLRKLLKSTPTYGINSAACALGSGGYDYLRITDIDEHGQLRQDGRAEVLHPSATHYFLEPDEIVVARTGASTGKSHQYTGPKERTVYAGFLIKLAPAITEVVPSYLFQFLQTDAYWSWIGENSVRSGQPGINGQQLSGMTLLVPQDLKEQKAIAEVLGDMDAEIQALDTRLEKARQVKEGMMQNLLTGRIRLV